MTRSILSEPKIILADEPTASLDATNSSKIASIFQELQSPDRIIIIATHEDCFDLIADEIILLDYGVIRHVNKNEEKNAKQQQDGIQDTYMEPKKKAKNNIFWICMMKRNKNKLKLRKIFPSIIIFLLFLVILSVQNNIEMWYMDSILGDYPYSMASLTSDQFQNLENRFDMKLYDNYTISSENISVYPLFDEKDSCLSYNKMIEYGKFPINKTEVIVSKEYVSSMMESTDYKNAIGKKIVVGQNEFVISGILSDLDNDEKIELYYSNVYYSDNSSLGIYVPYEALREIGQKLEGTDKMVKIYDLYSNSDIYKEIREYLGNPINVWDKKIVDVQYLIDSIFVIILCGLALLALIGIAFINNEVQLELFYRRKEIGFLQIFHFRKKKIQRMIIFERTIRIIWALAYALLLYIVLYIILKLIWKINIMISVFHLLCFIFIVISYSVVVTFIPCKKFLKLDIVSLIK